MYALLTALPLEPPAISTMPLANNVAVEPVVPGPLLFAAIHESAVPGGLVPLSVTVTFTVLDIPTTTVFGFSVTPTDVERCATLAIIGDCVELGLKFESP